MINYSVIKVYGEDSKTFLQGLITNDINLLETQSIVYTLLLNSKGRYNFDFFLIKENTNYLILIDKIYVDSFIKKLTFYKLASKVAIELLADYTVLTLKQEITNLNNILVYKDPRLLELGYKAIVNINNTLQIDSNIIIKDKEYEDLCCSLGVLEGSVIPQNSIPIELNLDELKAISYTKGCYLGQEFTNSAKNRLAIRKKIVVIDLLQLSLTETNKITIGSVVYNFKNEEIGAVIFKNQSYLLCLIKILDVLEQNIELSTALDQILNKTITTQLVNIEGIYLNVNMPYYINTFVLE